AMHAMLSNVTPDQSTARRCVMIRAIKSLVHMSKPPFNTNRREDANVAGGSRKSGCLSLLRDALRQPCNTAASAVLDGELNQNRNRNVSLPLTYRSVF